MIRVIPLLVFLFLCSYSKAQRKPMPRKPQHDPPIVVNKYTEALAYDICTNQLTVMNATDYGVGDTVLLVQMKGAVIDTSNTPAFGTILSYGNAGNYEFNYISQKTGNIITLKNKLIKNYDIPDGVVQLVRVPFYRQGYFSGGLTCDEWDGTKGGILAIFSDSSIISEEDIDVNGKGFRGGASLVEMYSSSTCNQPGLFYPSTSPYGAMKGESIGSLSTSYSKGRGNFGGGGGGGNSHNAGGGGGGNGGAGGLGGHQTDSCGASPFDNGGLGGKNILYSGMADKIFLGSGGGAGHIDESGVVVSYGGSGGGIVIIVTDSLWMRGGSNIVSNGYDGTYCFTPLCTDGMTGGGSGGTVLLQINQVIDSVTVFTKGGKGEKVTGPILPGGRPGPGGGGGGGVFYYNGSSFPSNMKYVADGGDSGVIVQDSNNPWGATKGSSGLNFFNLVLPIGAQPFLPNIDSVRIKDSLQYCNNIRFTGLGYTNTYPINMWRWDFGDGNSANTQIATHNFPLAGNYTVKLVATDINGCSDSITRIVNSNGPMLADAGNDQAVCAPGTATVTLNGSGTGTGFSWTPSAYLNNSTLQQPVATIPATTMFYLVVTNNTGCSAVDSVKITVNTLPIIKVAKSNDVNCSQLSAQLQATGGLTYNWTPASSLSNAFIANPVATPKYTTVYTVIGTNSDGCTGSDTVRVVAVRTGELLLPNSFTPDGNGLNDCFGIKYPAGVRNLRFMIYNYLGQKVFESSDPSRCWNGMYKGRKADLGNYVYYLTADTNCGPVELWGNVLLLR